MENLLRLFKNLETIRQNFSTAGGRERRGGFCGMHDTAVSDFA